MRGRPVEAGEQAAERAGLVDLVGDDVQTDSGEARRIAVGAEKQVIDLRAERCGDARENGAVADLQQSLVAATHASRAAAGEDEAVDPVGTLVHQKRYQTATSGPRSRPASRPATVTKPPATTDQAGSRS